MTEMIFQTCSRIIRGEVKIMSATKLTAARDYEKKYGSQITPEERPLFHVTPMVGWVNDPNGFSVYQGEYHLFFQYYPYDINWGPMHWGHVKSKDLVKWEHLPASLAPDEEYDKDGVFSGSAVETPDGRHLLMYTGVVGKDPLDCRQTQCMACGDGLHYKKYENNPVITAKQLPEGGSAIDFRDPKIWWDKEEQCYLSVVGNRLADGSGAVLLFSSSDGFAWKYVSTLDAGRNQLGKMWECPDFFELNGKALILISAQEMRAQGLKFHNGNDVFCLVGNYNRKDHRFTREEVLAVDYGLDFYAPQTVETPDGRRVMIAWMQAWESSRFHPEGAKWAGMFTIPRELSFVNGQLIQNPVREFLQYHVEPVLYQNMKIEGRTKLPGISGRVLDMTVEIRPDEAELFENLTIHIAENEEYVSSIVYDPREHTLCFDRTDSGFRYNIVSVRKAPVRDRQGKIRIRIILDRFSAEVFINDGEQVMSSCLYTPQEADGISFEAKGIAWIDVEKYTLTDSPKGAS